MFYHRTFSLSKAPQAAARLRGNRHGRGAGRSRALPERMRGPEHAGGYRRDRFYARVKAHNAVPVSEAALREQNARLYASLVGMHAERDEYKQAADALACAFNVLTAENDALRRQISRLREQAAPACLAPAG